MPEVMRLLCSEPSNFASVYTVALHIGEVPAPAPGPTAGARRPLVGAAWHLRQPQVEPSLSRPVPAQPHDADVRRACVA